MSVIVKFLTNMWIIGLSWSQLVPQVSIERVGMTATTFRAHVPGTEGFMSIGSFKPHTLTLPAQASEREVHGRDLGSRIPDAGILALLG